MENARVVAASAIALAATLFAIFSMRPWARRVGLVDRPAGRKQHVGRVPVIGGICFFVGTLVGLGYLGYVDRFVMSLMMGSALIVAIGVADDISHLSVRTRLLVEAAIVGLVILSTGYYLDHVGGLIPWLDLRLGLLGIPVTIVAVIGLMNAFNMLDGIDGLAASTAMVCIAAILLYSHSGVPGVGAMLMLQILFASLIPYVFVNLGWPDGRKIFMGDAGSTTIGFLVGWSLIYLSHQSVKRVVPVEVLWCVALPLMDTAAVMYRRMRRGRSPFAADRQHLHHLLLDRGLSAQTTLWTIVSMGAMLALLGYALRGVPQPLSFLVFVAVVVGYVTGFSRLLDMTARRISGSPVHPDARRTRGDIPDDAELNHAPVSVRPLGQRPHEAASMRIAPADGPRDHDAPLHALCLVNASCEGAGVAPIARRLADDDRFHATVCTTEGHGGDAGHLLQMFGLEAQASLSSEGGVDARGEQQAAMQQLLGETNPDVVVVPGDAPLTFAMSLAAHACDVPLVCVDADAPASGTQHWPSDASRRIVQSLAALHVAPSEATGRRLSGEGVPRESILVHADAADDALRTALRQIRRDADLSRSLAEGFGFLRSNAPLLLAVSARRDTTEQGAFSDALALVARRRPDVDIVWVGGVGVSPGEGGDPLHTFANVHPLEVDDFLAWAYLLERAYLVLVGTGAPPPRRLLGKPVLIVREELAGAEGGAIAIGTTPVAIAGRALTLLSDEAVYLSLCAAPDLNVPADDGCAPVLDALAGLRAPPPVTHASTMGDALGARAAAS
ncbi:UDP-N-acetylglucosamine 2-epimerase [Pseudoxanthomonas sp. LjRoot143]|uniref:UDP-N-acetylglucosamine 2-epimerase n=1 Tax=Pseudoxanthomonas sp. LjRoot143 TaxID=3342266 RepID=UPI003ECEFEA4